MGAHSLSFICDKIMRNYYLLLSSSIIHINNFSDHEFCIVNESCSFVNNSIASISGYIHIATKVVRVNRYQIREEMSSNVPPPLPDQNIVSCKLLNDKEQFK